MKITQTNKFRAADEVIPSVVGSIQSSGIPTLALHPIKFPSPEFGGMATIIQQLKRE